MPWESFAKGTWNELGVGGTERREVFKLPDTKCSTAARKLHGNATLRKDPRRQRKKFN